MKSKAYTFFCYLFSISALLGIVGLVFVVVDVSNTSEGYCCPGMTVGFGFLGLLLFVLPPFLVSVIGIVTIYLRNMRKAHATTSQKLFFQLAIIISLLTPFLLIFLG